MYTKKSIYLATSLFAATTLAFLVLSADFAEADDYSVDTIRITVPTSCTLNSTLDTAHTASMSPGEYKTNIGTTTFQVLCNDPGGFDVYAIGFSNDTYGTTTMINSSDSSIYFDTGTGQSGNSQWAMKLTPVSGTYAPTIQNGFGSYHVVPTTYTKVATFDNVTDGTIGSKVQSTYAVYVSTTQIAGTYIGKVRYTIVHPQDAGAPPIPVTTASGKISYNPNATGVTDTMGDQSISAYVTTATLWPSNFQRANYGFAGWTDKYDWVINENNVDGTGTGANAGYHIYGPNATIAFTAGQYSGNNPGLSLYAVWVPSSGYMQDFTASQCSSMSQGNVIGLKDKRDNQVYAVAKLADGKCWMMENLRLDDQYTVGNNINDSSVTNESLAQGYYKYPGSGTNYGNFVGLADPETANFSDSATANSLYSTTIDGNKEVIGTSNAPGYRFPRYNNQNTASPTNNMEAWNNNSNTYSVGHWYTWPAAIADTSYYYANNQSVTTTSICPVNWHLPTGGDKNNASNSEFWQLIVNGIIGTEPANTSGTEFPEYTGNTEGANASKLLRAYPNNYIYSGYFNGSTANNRGDYGNGFYLSSSVCSGINNYVLYILNSDVYPGTKYNYKYWGRSVRCLIGS